MSTKATKMAAQRLQLRMKLWPHVSESQIWSRKREAGFATVPRALPLIMQIADSFSKNTPVSMTYLDLWCRAFDEGYVKLDKPVEMALGAGFATGRGPSIWAGRLDLLERLGFIALAPGAEGKRAFALIFNPYFVIHNKRAEIDERLFNTLMAQAMAIGARTEPPALPPPPPSAPAPAPNPVHPPGGAP